MRRSLTDKSSVVNIVLITGLEIPELRTIINSLPAKQKFPYLATDHQFPNRAMLIVS